MPLRTLPLIGSVKHLLRRPFGAPSTRFPDALARRCNTVQTWTRESIHVFTGGVISLFYAYVVLWCFPLLYTARIGSVVRNGNRGSRRWKKFLGHIVRLSNAAQGIGFSSVCMGAYVTQNSYESNSAMLGLILMMQGIDTLVNAFIIFLYAELVAPHAQLNHHEADNDCLVMRIAMVLAVPASSLVWCLLMAVSTVMVYSRQASASQLDPAPYFRGQNTTPNPHDHGSTPGSSSRASIEAHEFSLGAQMCVGVMAGLYITRTLFVLYSILRLREINHPGRNNFEAQV